MQYRVGQIVLRKRSELITNDSAEFIANVKKGDRVFIRHESVSYVVHAVRSNTQIELSAPYRGESKTSDYSIHLDYTKNYGLMMPYYGDFNVEDILRFNLGKIDAVMAARFCAVTGGSGSAAQTYLLSIEEFSVNPPVAGGTTLSATYRATRSHAVQAVETQLVISGPTEYTRPWQTLYGDAATETISVIRAAGEYVATLAARDNKGNETARTVTFTLQGEAGGGLPVAGEWVFADVPTGNAQTIAARIDTTNPATRVMAIVIQSGGQISRALVVGGSFTANKDGPGGFQSYPVSVRFFNATKVETWTWSAAGSAPTLEAGGAYVGDYTVTASTPQSVPGSTNETRLAWSAVAPVEHVEVDVRIFYNGSWRDSLNRLMVFGPAAVQNYPAFERDIIDAPGVFPVKFKFLNTTKIVDLEWASATSPPVVTETSHDPNVLTDAVVSIDSLVQTANTLNATVVFKVNSPNPAHPTHYLIKVGEQIAVSDTPVNQVGAEISISHTLANLTAGDRVVKIIGSGQSVTDNEIEQTITIAPLAQTTAAPVLTNVVVTPGAGSVRFQLDIASDKTVTYKLLRNGVEVYAQTTPQAAGAVDQTVTVDSGAATIRVEVTDEDGRGAQSDNISATILPAAAGAATITNISYAYVDIDDGQGGTEKNIAISATLDVPDQSYGIHWRVFAAPTGNPIPAENTRPGFEWVAHAGDPVPLHFNLDAPPINTTYYIEACVANQFDSTTTEHIDAIPEVGNADAITINVTSTSAIDATSYTIDATLSNTLAEAMEYRIMEGGVEKKAWTAIANNGAFSETISAAAGTYAVTVEARSANIPATTSTQSIVVGGGAAAGGIQTGTFLDGTPLILDGLLKVELVMDWSASPPTATLTYTNLSADTTYMIYERFMQPWESAFTTQTFYEKTSGVAQTNALNTLDTSGNRVRYQVELRQADGTVLARVESEDLVAP